MKRLGRRTIILISGVVALVAAGSATALGAWSVPPIKAQVTVKAAEMPAGPAARAARLNSGSIRISWAAVSPSGVPVDSYRVVRYTAGQPAQTDRQRCTVTQDTQCVDATAKAGQTYTYTVQPVRYAWSGQEGNPSRAVSVTPVPVAPSQGPAVSDAHQPPPQTPAAPATQAPTEAPSQDPPTTPPATDAPSPSTSDQPSQAQPSDGRSSAG